jgi:hypothetical protein
MSLYSQRQDYELLLPAARAASLKEKTDLFQQRFLRRAHGMAMTVFGLPQDGPLPPER